MYKNSMKTSKANNHLSKKYVSTSYMRQLKQTK